MRPGVAELHPLGNATAQQPSPRATGTATTPNVAKASSPLTGQELRAQLRAQQARNTPATDTSSQDPGARPVAMVKDRGAHYRWHLTFADCPPLEVCLLPGLTAAEVVARYPRATATPLPETP